MKNQNEIPEMKISINQIKMSLESLTNIVWCGKDRLSGLEDKVYELKNTVKDNNKLL